MLSARRGTQTLPPPLFQATAPQEKPINLTLIGFSIHHQPGGAERAGWGTERVCMEGKLGQRLACMCDKSLLPEGPQFPPERESYWKLLED